MRVADRSTARNYLKQMNNAKLKYGKTNAQIASGNRFERLSEDVSAGTRVMRSRMDLYQSQKRLDNVHSVQDELEVTENSLMSMQEIVTSAHTLALKGLNGEKGETGRKAVANEIKVLREQLLNIANTKYGKKYVFGGTNASTRPPFEVGASGKLEYNGIEVDTIEKHVDGYYHEQGDPNKRIPMNEKMYLDVGLGIKMNGNQVEADTGFLISTSGLDVLGFGTDATSGRSMNVYNTLLAIEDSLINFSKDELGAQMDHLNHFNDAFRTNITEIGGKTKFLDIMQTRLEDSVDNQKVHISNLMGVDDAEAATTQAVNEYVLKAVIQMGSRILPVSLMDFLR